MVVFAAFVGWLIAVILSSILENVALYSLPLFLFIFSIFLVRKQNRGFFPLFFAFIYGFYVDILNDSIFYCSAIIFPVVCLLFSYLENKTDSFFIRSLVFSIIFSFYLFLFGTFSLYYFFFSFILFFGAEYLHYLLLRSKRYAE